jgi:hypothetical protein
MTFPRLARHDRDAAQMQAAAEEKAAKKGEAPVIEVEVRPGDAEVERNTRLVVEARFKGGTPAHAIIVMSEDAEGKKESVRVPMHATVENNAYGGVVKSVERDGFYRVEYEGGVSKTFRVTTYVHPELVRSDATITPPSYSGQPPKEIKNTLNVTALEGSEIGFRMTVNKPVAVAELFGEDKTSIPLTPSKDDPLVLEAKMKPEATRKYRLHLVDAQERSNKQPPWIKVNILSDTPPKVEMVFPKRDLAVSPLQEMPLEVKVWDDIAVEKAGAVFMIGGETKEIPLSDGKLAGKKSHDLKTMLALEQLKAKPRQLVSYYVWAEDNHPQGGVRRTMSDMFFAEVRHFEDIFREADSPPGPPGQGQQSVADKLAQLQKEVVNATWKLVRDAGGGKKFDKMEGDVGTVKEGQDTAIQQTEEALGEVEDAEVREALESAVEAMKRASGMLGGGIEKKQTNALREALGPEREALEHLGRAQSREHRVMRAQNQQQSGGQSQQNQRQLMQLELTQKEKRYEEESEAQDEQQTMEQQENLQVLNRLKELARRQEALAEKIKDVEEQLSKAKTEEEKTELQQQLKRLQEEQEQLLRDLDELQERMEKPENQQNMAQEREKLEEAREQARDAAEKLAQQETSAAANSATRAQENLEQVRDEFRERTAKRFADEMRQLKQQAAGLEQSQKQLAEALDPENKTDPKSGKDEGTTAELKKNLEKGQLSRQADAQREALDKMLENMQQLSEQAEASEPLLANSLHDAVRKAHSDGINDALEETKLNLQYSPADAPSSERKAAQGIEELKKGVDRAAESVLGSETEALRMARNELDRLLNDVEKDAQKQQQQQGEGAESGKSGKQAAQEKGAEGEAGQKPGDAERRMAAAGDASKEKSPQDGKQAQSSKPGEQQQAQPGQGKEPGKQGEGGEQPGALAGNNPDKQQQQQPGTGQGQQLGEQQAGQGQQPGQGEGQQPGQQQADMQPGEGQGKGQQPGQGQGQGQQQSQQASNGQQPGRGQGQGQGQGQQPSQERGGQGQGQGGQQPGQGGREQMTAGNTPGQGQGQQPGQGQRQGSQVAQGGNRAGGAPRSGADRNSSGGAEGGPGGDGGWFFDGAAEADNNSPLTGSNYGEWADRLRRVEEALENQELRNQAAGILENTRQIRIDNRRNDTPPQSDIVNMKVLQPLAELRDRVSEELAKRESANPLAPLDRDPVPHRYREMVRRYYRELGGGK